MWPKGWAAHLCPARKADVVFARAVLKDLCAEEGISHIVFTDFADVMLELDKMTVDDGTRLAGKASPSRGQKND